MLAWITWRCGSFALGDRLSLPRRWPPLQTRIAETKQTRRPVPVHNCSVRLSDVDVDPRVRIRPFDLRDLPLQRQCLGRIELARDGVMGDERLTSARTTTATRTNAMVDLSATAPARYASTTETATVPTP
jgi:hypothetical protein